MTKQAWFWFALTVLGMVWLILNTPVTFAANLAIEWQTQPGDSKPVEVAVFGEGASGPDDPKAIRFMTAKDSSGAIVVDATIRDAFPTTTYLGITARNQGDTTWWTHPDGSYSYVAWSPNVVVPPVVIQPPITPPLVTMCDLMVTALDKCLAKKNPNALTCIRMVRDVLKGVK